jgi:hypothetical protein
MDNIQPCPVNRTGLTDIDGKEIYVGHILELEVGGKKRRFEAKYGTVIREVRSLKNFVDEFSKVAITGVFFEWDGYPLFPCVDRNGVPDNKRMRIVGHVNGLKEYDYNARWGGTKMNVYDLPINSEFFVWNGYWPGKIVMYKGVKSLSISGGRPKPIPSNQTYEVYASVGKRDGDGAYYYEGEESEDGS